MPGQPPQPQDADFLSTVAAAADFIPSTTSNFIICAASLCRMGQLEGQTSSLTSQRSRCYILVIGISRSAISSDVCLRLDKILGHDVRRMSNCLIVLFLPLCRFLGMILFLVMMEAHEFFLSVYFICDL